MTILYIDFGHFTHHAMQFVFNLVRFLHYFSSSKVHNPKNMCGTPYQNYFYMLANDLNYFLREFKKILLILNTIFSQ